MSPEAELAKDRRTANATPTFQHRHFAYIASIIAMFDPDIREQIAKGFVSQLYLTNPNFDAGRFYAASGINQIALDRVVAEYEEIVSLQK